MRTREGNDSPAAGVGEKGMKRTASSNSLTGKSTSSGSSDVGSNPFPRKLMEVRIDDAPPVYCIVLN